jgi:hypothetical protein
MVSVRGTDIICTIQKINHLLYWLERTDMKNQFSKIKKTSFCRRPDPAEGGGGRAQIRRREEVALGLVVTEVGKEGVGGRCSASWSPRWGRRASVGAPRGCGHRGGEGGRRWVPLVVILIAVGAEVARHLLPPPRHAAADLLRLAMPPPPPCQAQRPPCHRLPRRLSPHQN